MTTRLPPSDPVTAYQLARKANGEGEYLLAIQIIETALAGLPDRGSLPLLQQKALALARSGSTHRALEILEQIRAEEKEDTETLGLLGRVYKDLASTAEPGERTRWLTESRTLYRAGFDRALAKGDSSGARYCSINAAAIAVLLDEVASAEQLAMETLSLPGDDHDYWVVASRAEAQLILRRIEDAAALYRRAAELAGRRWADIASTRKQCRLLSLKLLGRSDIFDACFPAGSVAAFTGPPSSEAQGSSFPVATETEVAARFAAWIESNSVRLTLSSAAAGSQLLFLKAAQQAGVETHVILPDAAANFVQTSVRPSGEQWVRLFHEVMDRVGSTTILNDYVADDRSGLVDFTNRMIAATAALRASALDFPLVALALWDGREPDSSGTAAAVRYWGRSKLDLTVMNPSHLDQAVSLSEEIATGGIPFDRIQTALPTGFRSQVCATLHLHFAGYFALHENEFPVFQTVVLGALAVAIARSSEPPESRYGFGPDYLFVFDAVGPAARFAVDAVRGVTDALGEQDRLKVALPQVFLHAGPVQLMVNPVLNQYSHEGFTMTQAGRIVRELEPGVLCCTEAFASLAALESHRELQFEYAGMAVPGVGGTRDRLYTLRVH